MTENPWNSYWKTHFTQYPNEQLVRFVANHFPPKERMGLRALDLGCGIGTQTLFLADAGFETYAVDSSETAINTAMARFEDRDNKAVFEKNGMTSLPFKDGTFSLIIDHASVQHCSNEDIYKALSEVHRVLKSDGFFWSFARDSADSLYGVGTQTGHNEYEVDTEELKGTGITHFFDIADIGYYFGPFFTYRLHKISRCMDLHTQNHKEIRHWEIWCSPK